MRVTAWALHQNLSRDDVARYLDDAAAAGFNAVPSMSVNAWALDDWENYYGDPSYLDDSTTKLNPPFWQHLDWVIDQAAARGLFVLLVYGSPGPGLGLDHPRGIHNINTPTDTCIDAPQKGIGRGASGRWLQYRQKDAGWDEVLMTYHPDGDPAYNSSNWFHRDVWLDFNGIETWKSVDKVYKTVTRDYALKNPVKPAMLLEGAYEQGKYPSPGNHISAHTARQQAYHTFFAGGAGHTYGGFPVWDFTRDPKNDSYQHTWRDAMKFPGAPLADWEDAVLIVVSE